MSKKRILIVDDEASFTRMVKLNLEKTGLYEVREENRAKQAVGAAREFNPDLILLDVVMPDMDGGDVVSQINADTQLQGIPIVFLTAVVSKSDAGEGGLKSGGQLFLSKPIDLAKLLECIEQYARK